MRICVLSYFFPPNNSSGAQRWSKLVKCLHRSGHEVCVISAVGDEFGGEDVDRGLEMGRYARVYRFFYRVPHRPPAMAESPIKELLKFFVIPDSRLPFFLKHLGRMERVVRMERPDVLVATAPPFSALVAGRYLSIRFNLPFVVDLRDPWLNDPQRPNRWAKYALERWVLSGADAVIVVNDREIYDEAVRFNRNVYLLEHPYDPEDYPQEGEPHPGEVRVSYVGSLFSSIQRDLIRGISERLPQGFVLRVFGPGTGRVLGRKEAFREMVSADVLLVLDLAKRKRKLGSSIKFYDYVGADRPVVVVSENPFLLKRAEDLGLTTARQEVKDIVRSIVSAYERGTGPNRRRRELRLDVACCRLNRILYRAISTRNS